MKAKTFCELIELAFREEYGDETEFSTVPYIHEDQGPMVQCLGVFLIPDQHMAVVAARAAQIMAKNEYMVAPVELYDAMDEFVEILHEMRVAPYMQWHCAYFPGLTEEQVLAGAEAFDQTAAFQSDGESVEDPPWPFEQLVAEFENLGVTVHRAYSGRMMHGKSCLGISGGLNAVQIAWGSVRERAPRLTCRALDVFKTDNLGHDTVMYFPAVETPAGGDGA